MKTLYTCKCDLFTILDSGKNIINTREMCKNIISGALTSRKRRSYLDYPSDSHTSPPLLSQLNIEHNKTTWHHVTVNGSCWFWFRCAFFGKFYRFYKVLCYTDSAAATGCDPCPAGSLGLCMIYRNSNFWRIIEACRAYWTLIRSISIFGR